MDPIARDQFWELLVELSRQQGVTIFISTHFMNEAECCDRISLMHAGQVLASDTPDALRAGNSRRRWKRLSSPIWKKRPRMKNPRRRKNAIPVINENHRAPRQAFSLRRLLAYAYREAPN